jgi:hypothetical protein
MKPHLNLANQVSTTRSIKKFHNRQCTQNALKLFKLIQTKTISECNFYLLQ